MGARKRFRDFRDWCPQPPDRLHLKLKRYSMPIAAVVSATLILSVSFFVFSSSSLISNSAVPIAPLSNGQSTWSTQTVSTDDAFGGIYMALDSNNNPHIVYTGANGLMYYASWDGSSWEIQSVIQGGTPNSLVLDSNNNPHILYKGANGVTYYASWDGSNWNFLTVPTGYGYSLALDLEGNPHLAYENVLPVSEYPPGVTNDISMLNYASWNGSNWSIQTVDKPISYTGSIYLALDSNNSPRIMYSYDLGSSFTSAVKFAMWNGSSWNIQTAFSNVGSIGNMVLDSNGYPHFVGYNFKINYVESNGVQYFASANSTMTYYSWNGSAWNTQIVLLGAGLSSDYNAVTLALDSHNYPHIEFFNSSLMYTSWTGASWNIQTVAPNNFAYGEGPLALDSNGNPIICYWVNDIRNTTAFVSQLIITSPTPLPTAQAPKPSPTALKTLPHISASVTKSWDFTPAYSEIISPVLADGYVYFTSGDSGAGAEALYCLEASNGAQIWNQTSNFNGFTVANGYVYASEAGAVACLNAFTGVQIWNYSYGTDFGTPTVAGGIVYAGGQNYTLSTDADVGSIYAFNASTGAVIWSYTGSAQTRFDLSAPVVTGESVYAVSAFLSDYDSSWHSAVYALDAFTGKELWNYTTLGEFSSLVTANQNVYIGSDFVDTTNYVNSENVNGRIYDGGILALNALDGAKLWSYSTESSVESLIVANSSVYAVSGDGTMYAFDAANGTVIWNYTTGTGLGSLLLANNYLYVGSSSGVYCFDATNGKEIWNFATGEFTDSSTTNPTYANGVIYLGWNGDMFFSASTQHNFDALDAWTGQKLWNYTLEYTVSSSPVAASGTVYIGGNFVSTKSPDFEGPGAVLALKSNVASLPFTQPSSSSTSTSSTPQTQYLLNPIVLDFLTVIVIVIVVMTVLLLRHRKMTNKTSPSLGSIIQTFSENLASNKQGS
jgi:outer membrane protein assembly factor BamB